MRSILASIAALGTALDVDTGAILWAYRGNPDQRAGVPMGRSSRGVAMGEGKIFVGLNDARRQGRQENGGDIGE